MQLKRKGLEEEAIPAADGLPSKKLKQELQFPTILQEQSPCPIIPEETPIITEVCPVEVQFSDVAADESSPALFITEPDSDERALVLYQPRNPSQATFPLHYKGFQVSDAVDWFSPSKSFRHRSALYEGSSNNNLAVVPYVAPYNAKPGADSYGGRVIIEDITDQVQESEEENQEKNLDSMMVEDSAPAPMEAEPIEPMDTSMDSSPAPAPQFCEIPYWQRFNSQHNNTPVMWS